VLDPNEVGEVEALVEFVGICRYFASERAINNMTQRVLTELRQYLDHGTRTLLESLRQSGEADCSFRQSQVDAAVRFCVKVFGQEHGSAWQGRGSRRRCGEQGGTRVKGLTLVPSQHI
jgi:hypothetical protein